MIISMFKHFSTLESFNDFKADHLFRYVNSCDPNESWPRNVLEITLFKLSQNRDEEALYLIKSLETLLDRGLDLTRTVEHGTQLFGDLSAPPSIIQYIAFLKNVPSETFANFLAETSHSMINKVDGLHPLKGLAMKLDHVNFNKLCDMGFQLTNDEAAQALKLMLEQIRNQMTGGSNSPDLMDEFHTMGLNLLKMVPNITSYNSQGFNIEQRMSSAGLTKLAAIVDKVSIRSVIEEQQTTPVDESTYQIVHSAFSGRGAL